MSDTAAYRSADGTETRRLAEPHRLVSAGRRWYLVAFDNDRDDWRIFRVDRIREALATGVRATPRALPAEDAAAFVTDKLSALTPTYRAVATMHAPAEQLVAVSVTRPRTSSRSTSTVASCAATPTPWSGWRSG